MFLYIHEFVALYELSFREVRCLDTGKVRNFFINGGFQLVGKSQLVSKNNVLFLFIKERNCFLCSNLIFLVGIIGQFFHQQL